MFKTHNNKIKEKKIEKIVNDLADHELSKSHARHLSYKRCKAIGLKVSRLEGNRDIQDAVLSIHHACIHTLGATPAYKIIENHDGKAFIQTVRQVVM